MQKFGGSWSQAKLDCVERYTKSYLKVMQNQRYELYYVDAFAGRGKQILKPDKRTKTSSLSLLFGNHSEVTESREFITGSAIRALRASATSSRPFDRFVFIDADQPSCSELTLTIQNEFPNVLGSVNIICGDANNVLNEYIDTINWTRTRALVFLDPYGLEVQWDLIVRLSQTRACDVWYLFPLGGVIRMMKKDGQMPIKWRDRLNLVFGTDEWESEFYRLNRGYPTLFGEEPESMFRDASTRQIANFIQKRLSTTFPAVSNPGILRNRKKAPLFALLLGVSSKSVAAQKAALRIANHLVKDLSQQ